MGNELIVTQADGSSLVVDWRSGEALDVSTMEVPELVEFRDVVSTELRGILGLLDEELIGRLDKANRKSFNLGDVSVYTSGGESIEWDGQRLYRLLATLESDGVIDPEALSEAVQKKTVYEVNAAAAKRLLNHPNEEVRDAAEASAVPKTTKRGIRTRKAVKRG